MLFVGRHQFSAPVFLAPMSGVTDAPFRKQADRFGASYTVTEMVASAELQRQNPESLRRLSKGARNGPFVVQLIGRDVTAMKASAQTVAAAGADIIDINMGCPSRKVTGGLSGSALMRDLDLAARLIEATLQGANGIPVTLKMRLGWDWAHLTAADLARRAEDLGVQLITVHGRTRQDFYKTAANWNAVRPVVDAVSIPVIVNGDINDVRTAREALDRSGADGIMVGRAATGKPWLPALLAKVLFEGSDYSIPSLTSRIDSLIEQTEDSMRLYGAVTGLKTMRKHIAGAFDSQDDPENEHVQRRIKSELCTETDPTVVLRRLESLGGTTSCELAA